MKTRKLNPIIEWPLIVIEAVLVICIISIDEMELSGIPILLASIALAAAIALILKKWGKQWKE